MAPTLSGAVAPREIAPSPAASTDFCDVTAVNPEAVARARASLLSDNIAADLAESFAVLGDPTRLKLIAALRSTELCVCDLAALLDLSQSAVSHQLRLMRTLRLVKNRRDGRVVYYSLNDDHIEHLFTQGLQHVAERG